jgi:hypothetical protein
MRHFSLWLENSSTLQLTYRESLTFLAVLYHGVGWKFTDEDEAKNLKAEGKLYLLLIAKDLCAIG